MKKILFSLSLLGILSANALDTNSVKNYENYINSQMRQGLLELEKTQNLSAMGISVELQDFKCNSISSNIECKSDGFLINLNNQNIAQAKSIKLSTSAIYKDNLENPSIEYVANSINKNGFYDEFRIDELELGAMALGFAAMSAAMDPKLSFLTDLADGKYQIKISDEYKNKNNLADGKVALKIKNIDKDIELNFEIDNLLDYPALISFMSKYGLFYDENIKTFRVQDDYLTNLEMQDEDTKTFLSSITFNALKLKLKYANITNLMPVINDFEQSIKEMYGQEKEILQEILNDFKNNHEFLLKLSNKDGINLKELISYDEITSKINELKYFGDESYSKLIQEYEYLEKIYKEKLFNNISLIINKIDLSKNVKEIIFN